MISNKDQTTMVSKTQEKETQKKEDSVMEEQKKAKENTADIQRNGFQLTINNPEDHGLGHTALKRILMENFTTLDYYCMADEIGGETETYHTHLYVHFASRVRVSTVKKHFPPAHIEVANGTAKQNIDYVKKAGKWADTEKSETRVEGTFEEWGTVPHAKGRRQEMAELYDMVKAGYTNSEIINENPDYIVYLDKLDKLRTMLLVDKYKGTRRLDLKVVYLYGATGQGKTRSVLDTYGDSSVYKVTNYKNPFDLYACQPVMCFDEFRSQLPISDMLEYLDVYPLILPARYNDKVMCAEIIYMTSNLALEDQYSHVQTDSPETWKAFLRRIHEVHYYDEKGNITVYDSMEKYLNRRNSFHEPTQEELLSLPFTDGKGGEKDE